MERSPIQGFRSMWYDHYKGSVYPLDLEGPACCQKQNLSVPTLLDASCRVIVCDSNLTNAALDTVPHILSVHLMEAALQRNNDRAINTLVSRWLLKSLVLSKLVPNVFSSILPLYQPLYQADMVRQGLRYTTALAHTYLESLRQNSPTKIRYLDLTGFPTAEVILYYLTSHCMLVHNEVRRDNVVNLYNQAVNLVETCTGATEHQHSTLNVESRTFLTDDISIMIKLDAMVTSDSCHSELCKALAVSSFPGTRFQIVIEKLSITCLGRDRITLLLKQINPEHLKGLQLKYNSLGNSDFIFVAPVIQTFVNLTSLDLSCNNISVLNTGSINLVLRHALATLRKLERLDLSNNRLKNKLATILSGLPNPLKQLRLTACGLTVSDTFALSNSSHLDCIEELDLSENNLTISREPLMKILDRIKDTIKVLEMEDCSITDEVIHSLSTKFHSGFYKLLYMNIADNAWDSFTSRAFLGVICLLHKIKVLRLSYPRDCYPIEGFGVIMEEESKDVFRASINEIIRAGTLWDFRSEQLKVVYVDLERTME